MRIVNFPFLFAWRLWEAVEDATEIFTYFVELPLLPKNLTQNSVIIVCPTFSILISLIGHFILKSGLLTILSCWKLTKIYLSACAYLCVQLNARKWMRNFRGNCLSQLVILLLVWLMSRLSELFFTPYSLEILVNFESFPKCHSVICKTGPSQSWEDARTYYKDTKKKREALPWA